MSRVPVIDISPALKAPASRDCTSLVVDALRLACEDTGFFLVTGHGVAAEKIDAVVAASHSFFALPLELKARSVTGGPRGYHPQSEAALARSRGETSPPDLVEVYSVGRFDDPGEALRSGLRPGAEAYFAPNAWPAQLPGFRPAFEQYYGALEKLANDLLSLFALALGLERTWFADKADRHISNLMVNYYPAQFEAPLPGQLRRGAHSDWGSLTVLFQDDSPGGLEILNHSGDWEPVPAVPGTFVVNIGDLLAMWTNDRWRSTVHRVVNPSRVDADRARVSIPYFHQPNFDAVIECIPSCRAAGEVPRHAPTTSGAWLQSMLAAVAY
jgi:isopenicillin N synthase-like dioxygenase